MKNLEILVLDFGKENTQQIARDLRDAHIYTEILPYYTTADEIKAKNPKAIICAGKLDDESAIKALKIPFASFEPDEKELIRDFAVANGAEANWSMKSYAEHQIELIKQKVGNDKVLLALSGGVDSSVVALLLYRAIGDQLVPVFVDHGLLRKNEADQVKQVFATNLQVPLVAVDAKGLFLGKLKGVTDPEEKRKIIGHTFIEVFESEAKKHSGIKYLAQGTIYPDIIESINVDGTKAIKSHHNVGGLPEWMDFELIEPIRDLFKDEVRLLGLELGLPKEMIYRHPFPGPGLGVRVMGELNEPSISLLQEADHIMIEELKNAGYYDKVWQAFCVLLNVKSVGIKNGKRSYQNTVAIRSVNSVDAMSAGFSHLPFELLQKISDRIINEIDGISRVVYDISSKPPATIEWE